MAAQTSSATLRLIAELGDLSRFANPRQLMAYLGLVPSEHSSGASVKRGDLTKLDDNRRKAVTTVGELHHPVSLLVPLSPAMRFSPWRNAATMLAESVGLLWLR